MINDYAVEIHRPRARPARVHRRHQPDFDCSSGRTGVYDRGLCVRLGARNGMRGRALRTPCLLSTAMTARFALPHLATTDICLFPANDLDYGTEFYGCRKIYTTGSFGSRLARCRSQGTAFLASLGVLWTLGRSSQLDLQIPASTTRSPF